MRILFLSRWYPYPSDNGSKLRVGSLLRGLARQHDIALVSFSEGAVTAEQLEAAGFCSSVEASPYIPFQPRTLRSLLGLFASEPRSLRATFSEPFFQLAERRMNLQDSQLVIASQIDMIPYALRLSGPPRILEELEILKYEEVIEQTHEIPRKLRLKLMRYKTAKYIARVLPAFAGCTVVSQNEQSEVFRWAPTYKDFAVIPNGVEIERYNGSFGAVEPYTLVYPGALNYSVNFDAIYYFLREIFPLICARQPEAKLYITGKSEPAQAARLPRSKNVIFTGYLNDIRQRIAQSSVCIVPLLIGGGTRLKILEALALGTPVVSTSKGAEGLDLVNGRDFLVADSPEDFAGQILRLWIEPGLSGSISRNGRQTVSVRYDWRVIHKQLSQFIDRVVVKSSPVARP